MCFRERETVAALSNSVGIPGERFPGRNAGTRGRVGTRASSQMRRGPRWDVGI